MQIITRKKKGGKKTRHCNLTHGNCVGYEAERIVLSNDDINVLGGIARRNPHELAAVVQQLQMRLTENRQKTFPAPRMAFFTSARQSGKTAAMEALREKIAKREIIVETPAPGKGDWVEAMFDLARYESGGKGFFTGGPVPNSVRVSHKHPNPQMMERGPEAVMPRRVVEKTARHINNGKSGTLKPPKMPRIDVSGFANLGKALADFQETTLRKMAAEYGMTYSDIVGHPWPVDIKKLHGMDKTLFYKYAYSNFDALQQRVDEEGCGGAFAAARYAT